MKRKELYKKAQWHTQIELYKILIETRSEVAGIPIWKVALAIKDTWHKSEVEALVEELEK